MADPYAAARATLLKEHPEYTRSPGKQRAAQLRDQWRSAAPVLYADLCKQMEEDREALITQYRTAIVDHYCAGTLGAKYAPIYQRLHEPQVRAYLEKLDWWLNRLRLLRDGQPAEWAAPFVHNDVLAAIGT